MRSSVFKSPLTGIPRGALCQLSDEQNKKSIKGHESSLVLALKNGAKNPEMFRRWKEERLV